MTQLLVSGEGIDLFSLTNSVVLPTGSFGGSIYSTLRSTSVESNLFQASYAKHRSMLSEAVASPDIPQPICYVRFVSSSLAPSVNSSADIGIMARKHYDAIETQLLALAEDPAGADAEVEEGAARTALSVVEKLRGTIIPPPDISWHGGDAVVMLWRLGDTTYAITVTDGELGYVVRRSRKAIKLVDSIMLHAFRLEDLR